MLYFISAIAGKLIGLLFVLLRNHAAMLRAFTTYSNTATLVKYYCPKLTTSTDGNVQGGWVQKEEFETNCASVRPAATAAPSRARRAYLGALVDAGVK